VSAAYHANRNEIFRERNVGARGLSVRIIKLDGYYGRYGGKKLRGRSTAGGLAEGVGETGGRCTRAAGSADVDSSARTMQLLVLGEFKTRRGVLRNE